MKDNTNLRTIWAVALSFIFIVGWSYFFSEKPQESHLAQQGKETPVADKVLDSKIAPSSKVESKNVPSQSPIAKITSKNFEIDIDSTGRFSQVYLKGEKHTTPQNTSFIDHIKALFGSPVSKLEKLPLFKSDAIHPLEMRFEDEKTNTLSFQTPYVASSKQVNIDNAPGKLTLTQKLANGVVIQKILTIYPNLNYDLEIKLNKSSISYFITSGERPFTEADNYAFNGVILSSNDKITKIEDGDAKETQSFNNADFIASVDRYYTTLFYPIGDKLSVSIDKDAKNDPIPYIHARGDSKIKGYVGPKDYEELKSLDPHLTKAVEYGLLTFFAKPLFILLEFLHGLTHNWGFAIILLTILVKIVLFPLSYKGMVGMQKMKEIAPKMKELQQKYKSEPDKLRIHMMELYKKHGANPMGGCLPLLIQIPIFYSIYRVLYNSVELKSAEFIFWIHDLSVLDPYFVLPVLMGISMYYQQHLTPSTITDPTQAKIFKMLPIFFTIFLMFFPAGLVLYWTINNVLTILQQLYINNMINKKKLVK